MAASLLSSHALVLTDSCSKKQSLVARARSQEGNQGPRTDLSPHHPHPTPPKLEPLPHSSLLFSLLARVINFFLLFGLKYLLTSALQLGHHFLSHFCTAHCIAFVFLVAQGSSIFSVDTMIEENRTHLGANTTSAPPKLCDFKHLFSKLYFLTCKLGVILSLQSH